MDKTEGVLKNFLKKDKKGSLWILDSINCPSLIIGNGHMPISYLSNIMSPCLILKAKMSAIVASILLLNFSICSTAAKPSVFLLQSPFLF